MKRVRATLRFLRRNAGVIGFLIIVAGSMWAYALHGNDIGQIRAQEHHLAVDEHKLAVIQKALIKLQTTNHATNCATVRHEWDTIDAIIVKVDQDDPGVRAKYEPLLGPRPVCTPLVVTTPTTTKGDS